MALGIQRVAAIKATIAEKGLKAAMLSNPALLVALGIGVLIGVVYKWIQSVGGARIAWLIAVDKILTGWDLIKIGFMTGIIAVANFMGQMRVNVLTELQNMIDGGIDLINGFINAVNKIPGVAFDTIDHLTFATRAQIEFEAHKASRNTYLEQMERNAAISSAQRQYDITLARQHAAANKATGFDLSDFGTGNNPLHVTSKDKLDVDMSDEDLKYLRDIAQREYINKFTTATLAPNITVKFGDVHEEADADKLYGRVRKILREEIAMAAEGSYA